MAKWDNYSIPHQNDNTNPNIVTYTCKNKSKKKPCKYCTAQGYCNLSINHDLKKEIEYRNKIGGVL
jgi:hypothetical protein